jgi:hypothetical protein
MTVHEKSGGMRQKPPTAYLETSIVSGFARGQMSDKEQAATVRLIELWHEGRVSLVTSSITRDEIDRCRQSTERRPRRSMRS